MTSFHLWVNRKNRIYEKHPFNNSQFIVNYENTSIDIWVTVIFKEKHILQA